MASIRFFLTVTIISTIVLVNFVSSLEGYLDSMERAEEVFDTQLRDYVHMLALAFPENDAASHRLSARRQQPPLYGSGEAGSMIAFQVFDSRENLLARWNTTATTPVSELEPGYADVNFDNYRWRSLVYHDAGNGRWVIAAQRDDLRYTLAENVVLESMVPILLGIPIAGLLVWLIVGWGLRPVNNLARALRSKEASDLSAVQMEGLPRELLPLQASTNGLLRRLQGSFEREKRFAADAAHELRTPISILKVQMHNLLSELDTPLVSTDRLKAGIDRMGYLVEQILDLNRTAPDQFMAQFERLDLYALTSDVVSVEYEHMARKQQEFELRGEHMRVNGDRFSLELLVKNLLINASRYTPAGGNLRITLEKPPGGSSGQSVAFTLEDSGPGIPESQYDRVFERFYRVESETSENAPGCGLGLAIVKHIVDLHQASITLSRSKELGGLRVDILFTGDKGRTP